MSLQLLGRPAGQNNPSAYPAQLLSISTSSSLQRAINATHQYGNGESTDAMRPWCFSAQYLATDGVPGVAHLLGLSTTATFGQNGASPVAPLGNVHSVTTDLVVQNSGSQSNGFAASVSTFRFDMGTGFPASSSTPGRGWLYDTGIYGPVGLQANLLTGTTRFINNYQSVQPVAAKSGAVFVVTQPGAGTGTSALHAAATTYPVGVGLSILGASGASNAGLGFNVGIRVGGMGSGWDVTTLRIQIIAHLNTDAYAG